MSRAAPAAQCGAMTSITRPEAPEATERDLRGLGPALAAAAMLLVLVLGVALVAGQLVEMLRWVGDQY